MGWFFCGGKAWKGWGMEAVWRAASGDIFLSLVRQSAKRVQLGESGRARRSDKGGERTMERERERERERESTKNKEGESTQHTPREKRKERAMRERRARDLARENHSSCKIRLWAGWTFLFDFSSMVLKK